MLDSNKCENINLSVDRYKKLMMETASYLRRDVKIMSNLMLLHKYRVYVLVRISYSYSIATLFAKIGGKLPALVK